MVNWSFEKFHSSNGALASSVTEGPGEPLDPPKNPKGGGVAS